MSFRPKRNNAVASKQPKQRHGNLGDPTAGTSRCVDTQLLSHKPAKGEGLGISGWGTHPVPTEENQGARPVKASF